MERKRAVPDVNPADQVAAKMHAAARQTEPRPPALKVPNRETDLNTRLGVLEDLVTGINTALLGISGTAVCNGDGTITITITLPGLPGA